EEGTPGGATNVGRDCTRAARARGAQAAAAGAPTRSRRAASEGSQGRAGHDEREKAVVDWSQDMETKRRYEHPTPAADTMPAAVSPERALRVFAQPER